MGVGPGLAQPGPGCRCSDHGPVASSPRLVTQGVGGAGIVNITFWGRTLAACEPLQGQRLQLEEAVPCKHVPPCDEDAGERPDAWVLGGVLWWAVGGLYLGHQGSLERALGFRGSQVPTFPCQRKMRGS